MSDLTRSARAGIALSVVTVLVWFAACSDNPPGPCTSCPPPPPSGLIVSNPVASIALAPGVQGRVALAGSGGSEVVYVSLAPGTVPTGSQAVVRRVGDAASLTTAVADGGFDPVPVVAQAGDSIEVLVTDAAGGTVLQTRAAVLAARPPVIVRTEPPVGKRDVPLNASLVIVFSEPVNGGTLTSSTVQLFHGSTAIAGTATLLQGTATSAVFTPASALSPNTDYQLTVTQGVQDLQGDPLPTQAIVSFTTGTGYLGEPNFVEMLPDTAAVGIGSQVQLTAIPFASADTMNPGPVGEPITGLPIIWMSDNPTVATVSPAGLVTALTEGEAHIQAQVDGRFPPPSFGVTTVFVSRTLAPVASVQVTPKTSTVPTTGSITLTAVLKDADGNVLPFRPITWGTSNGALATVALASATQALATGVSPGNVTITAASEGVNGTAAITVVRPGPYQRLTSGLGTTCGVTTDSWAFCWGWGNRSGMGGSLPVAVTGGVHYSQIATREYTTCALEPGGAAHCWGGFPLGDGSDSASVAPVAVSGGLQFASIAPGSQFTCGLTTGGAAYCWGWGGAGLNGYPQYLLGTGNSNSSAVPVPVAGGHSFTALAVGYQHTCALDVAGAAWCWGRNAEGELGDSDQVDRASPIPVRGRHTFVAITAGWFHTCGLLANGSAYCWGANQAGQLGTTANNCTSGGQVCNDVPVPVAGGRQFAQISAGAYHTCAITAPGAAWCWPANGTTGPVAVPGGLNFASINAGGYDHSCGVSTARIAYCWGGDWAGQLGDGTTNDSNVPVRVAGQP